MHCQHAYMLKWLGTWYIVRTLLLLTLLGRLQTIKYTNKQRHKLYVCNVPRNLSRAALTAAFKQRIRGVVDVDATMQKDQGKPDENRGFCFVEMYNQAAAEAALKELHHDAEFAGACAPETRLLSVCHALASRTRCLL